MSSKYTVTITPAHYMDTPSFLENLIHEKWGTYVIHTCPPTPTTVVSLQNSLAAALAEMERAETRAAMAESRATMAEARANMAESRAAMAEARASMVESHATIAETMRDPGEQDSIQLLSWLSVMPPRPTMSSDGSQILRLPAPPALAVPTTPTITSFDAAVVANPE